MHRVDWHILVLQKVQTEDPERSQPAVVDIMKIQRINLVCWGTPKITHCSYIIWLAKLRKRNVTLPSRVNFISMHPPLKFQ